MDPVDYMEQRLNESKMKSAGWGMRQTKVSDRDISVCLKDSIVQNKGTFTLSRGLIKGIVEATILKSAVKLKDGKSFTEHIEEICDNLISPDYTYVQAGCMTSPDELTRISVSIRNAIMEHVEEEEIKKPAETEEKKMRQKLNDAFGSKAGPLLPKISTSPKQDSKEWYDMQHELDMMEKIAGIENDSDPFGK